MLLPPERVVLEQEARRRGRAYTGPHDLALLLLDLPLATNRLIQPLCLPLRRHAPLPASEQERFVDTRVKAFIAGYGKLIPNKGSGCLTDGRGPRRFHICADAGVDKPCRRGTPPSNATGPAGGGDGWCRVRPDAGEEQVPAERMWGWCSASCSVNYTFPFTYHEQAPVDILPPGRCSE